MSTKMGLANLHDTFLNASLQRREMHRWPLVDDPDKFHISDRGRFERAWAAFLYVLVESWQSESMSQVRKHVRSVTDAAELDATLEQGQVDGSVAKLREVRHYMCHRDRREYWDQGRLGVLLQLDYNERLHAAFSKVLLGALRSSSP